jgi:uncharacterized protein (DUF2336 family)
MTGVLSRLFTLGRGDGRQMDYEEAKALAADQDAKVRRKLARRADAQPEILYYLAEDRDEEVRRGIAANEATPVQADLLLSRDRDEEVRCRLARKIAVLAPTLSAEEQERVGDIVGQTLEVLAEDQLIRVRAILVDELKCAEHVPGTVIERLARDSEISISGPVLENSPLLDDELLLEIINSRHVQGVLAAVSRRQDLGSALADAIVETNETDAITALLSNSSAQIREETLDELVERAERKEDWHAPLVGRPKLSGRAVRGLAGYVAGSLLQSLQSRNDLDAETAGAVYDAISQRLAEEAEPGEPLPEERAEAMHAKGKLNEGAVDTALGKGDRGFVIAALALASGLSRPAVQKVVSMASAKGIVAVAWRAGFSMGLAEQLQLRLGRIAPDAVMRAGRRGGYTMSEEELDWQIEFFAS